MSFRTPFKIGWTAGRFVKKGRDFFVKWLGININEELFSSRKIGGPSPLLGGLGGGGVVHHGPCGRGGCDS
jgi:hypothetical protein